MRLRRLKMSEVSWVREENVESGHGLWSRVEGGQLRTPPGLPNHNLTLGASGSHRGARAGGQRCIC